MASYGVLVAVVPCSLDEVSGHMSCRDQERVHAGWFVLSERVRPFEYGERLILAASANDSSASPVRPRRRDLLEQGVQLTGSGHRLLAASSAPCGPPSTAALTEIPPRAWHRRRPARHSTPRPQRSGRPGRADAAKQETGEPLSHPPSRWLHSNASSPAAGRPRGRLARIARRSRSLQFAGDDGVVADAIAYSTTCRRPVPPVPGRSLCA